RLVPGPDHQPERGQPALLPPAGAPAGSGHAHHLEKIPGLFPGGGKISGAAGGKRKRIKKGGPWASLFSEHFQMSPARFARPGQSSTRPSTERVTTCQGMNFPLACSAFFTASSRPPQQGTSMRTTVTL